MKDTINDAKQNIKEISDNSIQRNNKTDISKVSTDKNLN